jgi:aspartyl-tRNA(Asn)/glutamyl-tRNA(Gln) amidotransferase subunit A
VFPLSETLDGIGLLGADITTVAVAFSALTGHRIDPTAPVDGTMVGRPTDSYWRVYDPEITAAVDRAAAALETAGAILRDVSLPGIEELAATYYVIVDAEAYATHTRWLAQRPGDYQPITAARLQAAARHTAADYVAAQRTRRRLAAEMTGRLHTAGVDLLLLPTTPLRATPIGAAQVHAPDGTQVAVRPALLSLTLPFNLLGRPAVSVPAPGVTGLPAGIQVAGVLGGEQAVLAAGARIAAG